VTFTPVDENYKLILILLKYFVLKSGKCFLPACHLIWHPDIVTIINLISVVCCEPVILLGMPLLEVSLFFTWHVYAFTNAVCSFDLFVGSFLLSVQ